MSLHAGNMTADWTALFNPNFQRHKIFDILERLPYAELASYKSDRTQPLTTCLPGTRTGLLANITEWLENPESPEQVFWLKGSLGTGKTSISASVAEMADEKGLLGGNFFFSRFHEALKNPRLLFPTIARQLARYNPDLKRAIADAVMDNDGVALMQPRFQFNALIARTIQTIQHSSSPILFIFDGLDEFESTIASYQDIMRLFIHNLAALSPNVRVFVTSRPEPYIGGLLMAMPAVNLKLHNLDDHEAQRDDIATFLWRRLTAIPEELAIGLEYEQDNGWFSKDEFGRLTARAGQSFLYASTAIRFIADPVARDPRAQLSTLLNAPSHPSSELDQLYLLVLQRAFPQTTDDAVLERLRSTLAVIGLSYAESLEVHAGIVGLSLIDAQNSGCLVHLQSVISLRPGITIYHHQSFFDFLSDPAGCVGCVDPRFLIDREHYHAKFARRCLKLFESCWSPSTLDEALFARKSLHVSDRHGALILYACRAWPIHVRAVNPENEGLLASVMAFLGSNTFVAWIFTTPDSNSMDRLIRVLLLSKWNCSLKGSALAAMRRCSLVWEAFQRSEAFSTVFRQTDWNR
ncbi:hypothetical protein HGRIS_008554 [Hohenbuehelia grisea]|uniref:Nephrocystin 3-like N-terminal domain-containing protein n=1 Tax=Hohenbuehelia grisea TaxID=104357 RepID=A0ABR3J8C8_9AGAR